MKIADCNFVSKSNFLISKCVMIGASKFWKELQFSRRMLVLRKTLTSSKKCWKEKWIFIQDLRMGYDDSTLQGVLPTILRTKMGTIQWNVGHLTRANKIDSQMRLNNFLSFLNLVECFEIEFTSKWQYFVKR